MGGLTSLERADYRTNLLRPLYYASGLTIFAEVIYFIVWGILIFPDGNLLSKFAWALTCGVAMGAVIGVATIILVTEELSVTASIAIAALAMATIGSYCGFLCSRIDAHFNYFGGQENTTLFILSGVVPAIIGGGLYGWLLYGRKRNSAKMVGSI